MLKKIKGFENTTEAKVYEEAIQQRVGGATLFTTPAPQKPAHQAPKL